MNGEPSPVRHAAAAAKLLDDFAEDERRHELAPRTVQNRTRILSALAAHLAPRTLLDATTVATVEGEEIARETTDAEFGFVTVSR